MKADIKTKWIAALRSGQYEQTTEILRSTAGYCCLGVLCDLYSRETGVPWQQNAHVEFSMHGGHSVLPYEVEQWAGLTHEHGGYVAVNKRYDEGEDTIVDHSLMLTELNDSWEYNFHQIADVIEEQL
jgi:hypothetical protein